MIPAFDLVRPSSLEDALREVASGGVPYVGGTELVAAMHLGLVAPEVLVDLKSVRELEGIRREATGLCIGATSRHDAIAAHADVAEGWPLLARACSQLGNQRVRATGTIGGNLCFADPRSDVSTALFALDASVTLCSSAGRRTLPIDQFVLGAMDVDLADGELLESVHLPTSDSHQVYLRHQPAEYPTVCVAVVKGKQSSNAPLRITIGAVGERPESFDAASVDDLRLDDVLPVLDVIEDLNGSESYKRHLAGVFVRRAVAMMKEIAGV